MADPREHGLETGKGRRMVEWALQVPSLSERQSGRGLGWHPWDGWLPPRRTWDFCPMGCECLKMQAQVPFLVPDGGGFLF